MSGHLVRTSANFPSSDPCKPWNANDSKWRHPAWWRECRHRRTLPDEGGVGIDAWVWWRECRHRRMSLIGVATRWSKSWVRVLRLLGVVDSLFKEYGLTDVFGSRFHCNIFKNLLPAPPGPRYGGTWYSWCVVIPLGDNSQGVVLKYAPKESLLF